MSIGIYEKYVDTAIAELELLNSQNEAVSQDLIEILCYEGTLTILGSETLSIVRIIELLAINPIQFSSEPEHEELFDSIRYLIGRAGGFYYETRRLLPESQRTAFYRDLFTLLDKTWYPTLESKVVPILEMAWLADREVFNHSDYALLEYMIEVVNSRLPKTHEAWQLFYRDNRSAYDILRAIERNILKNGKYWNYYFTRKTQEHLENPAPLTQEWAEELFGRPLMIPSFR